MYKMIMTLYCKVQAAGKEYEISEAYEKLETDEDRVIFTLNTMQEYNVIPITTGMPKNAIESKRLREQGNEWFVKSGHVQYGYNMPRIQALQLYTRSIRFAPYPSVQLALAYANRSAVLIELGLYSECIQDIDRALALNYPDGRKAKLYVRKTHCLVLLGNQTAENMMKETVCLLEKMSLNKDRIKLQDKLDVLQKTIKTDTKTTHAKCDHVEQGKAENVFSPPSTIISPNNEVPCASDAIAIKYNESLGRHVVATRDIRPGEVIAVEEPYSLLLMQENMQTHCSNCLKVCWANIPCKYCTYAMYCSEECRDIEWKKCHDMECTVFPAIIEHSSYDMDLFSLRLAVLAVKEAGGIQELKAMLNEDDKRDDPRTNGFSQDGKLYSNKYISVYNFVRHTKKRSVSDLFQRSFDTSFILYFLATRTTMFGTKLPKDLNVLMKNDDVTFLGGLILRHQQMIGNTMHGFSEERGLSRTQFGMAAMPFLSLINHGCNPNIIRYSIPEHIMVCAAHPIKKGEQILDNYGYHYAKTPKIVRRLNLYKRYFFICDCIACQEDWPLYLDLKSYQVSVKKANDKAKINKAVRKFNTYVDLAMEGNVLDKPFIIKDLLMMIQVLYDYVPMPCQEMIIVVDILNRVYSLNGNRFVMPKVVTLQT